MGWQPSLGAWREGSATHFRVWVPEASKIEVVLETSADRAFVFPLAKSAHGFFEGVSADVRTGDFALVNGKPYRRPALDAAWVLERFPPALEAATSS